MRHERRHHHDRRALPHPRLELPLHQVAVGRRAAAERLGERGQRAAGGRRLHAGVETPAEGVAAVRKADDRAVERDGGEIGFQPAGVAGESLAVEPAAGGGQGHRDLQLAAAGVGLVDVLLLDRRVEGEDADRPAGADILGEGGPGLGRRIGAVEGAGVFGRGAGAAKRGGRLADVFDEPLIEQGALHEDAPGEHGGGGAADGHRRLRLAAAEVGIARDRGVGGAGGGREEPGSVSDAARLGGRHAREEPAADTAELGRVAAADERGQVPAGQFLPDVAVGRDREEVEGGVEFRLQMGADAHVGDARTVGRIVLEGRAGVADQNRDLADARDVGQLREGNRQPGPPGLHRRHRGGGDRRQAGREGLHRRHHTLATVGLLRQSGLRLAQVVAENGSRPGEALRIVDGPGEGGGDDVDQVVDHEVAEGGRQQVVAQDRLGDEGDFRAVPLAGEVAGGDRDGHPHEVQRVAG